MNPMATYQKRLREEVAAVENEIRSQHQRIEVLNKRLEGLKRALELVQSCFILPTRLCH
jgi:predicted nuclease with TOPRIM domain